MKHKYLHQLSSAYSLIFIQILIPILLTPYMIEKLGSEYYGLWVLMNSVIVYFNLSNLGFDTTLLKEVSHIEDKTLLSKYITTTLIFFIIMIMVSLFVFILILLNLNHLFILSSKMNENAKLSFILMYFIFVLNFIFSIFNTLLFAKGFLHIQNLVGIIISILTAVLMFIILFRGYSIIEIIMGNLVMTIFSSLVTLYIVRKNLNYEVSIKYFDYKLLKKMFMPSLYYFIISIAVLIIFYSDNLIISSFIGLSAVAIYSIGYRLIDTAQKLIFKITDILLPNIAILYKQKEYNKILKLHNSILLYSMSIAIPGYSFLYFFGIDILEFWVGKKYTLDSNILTVFIVFAFIHTWVHVSAIFVSAMGIHKETSYMAIFEAALNIIFSLVLMNFYGLLGIALGTLIAHVLTSAWFVTWWFYKTIHQDILFVYKNVEKEEVH